MRAVIVLAVVFAILHFGLKFWVAPKFGVDVKARFVERLKYIPSFKTPGGQDGRKDDAAALNEANFAAWLAKPDNRPNRRGYAFPVLFPLDILFLVALGSLLGMASLASGRTGRRGQGMAGLGLVAVSGRLHGVRSVWKMFC